ncbi:MAG: exodeoxyribonuclease VII large subunit [Fidelibacterota bacterium]
MNNKTNILTVSEVADRIEAVINDYLPSVYVEGEVSNYYRSKAGHIYLSIKDDKALVNCVVWSYNANRIKFQIEDGMRVVIFGDVVTYKLRSQYQIKVLSIRPSGMGYLYLAFEELKAKLEKEGLFDPKHKKPIPKYPTRIGVITSPTSAAVRDIIQVSGRRNPAVQLVIYPAVVQGEEAAETIIHGIRHFNAADENKVDLIIVSRGGGSIEDLWSFNEESVVRAIYDSELPVVTGIGHEIDFTLSDFAADYRAPTPSAAAEESIPNLQEIRDSFDALETKMISTFKYLFDSTTIQVRHLNRQIALLNPATTILNQIQHIDDMERRLQYQIQNKLKEYQSQLEYLSASLKSLNPESILERGYAIVTDKNNNFLKSIKNVHLEDKLTIKLSDGKLNTSVLSITENNNKGGEKNE